MAAIIGLPDEKVEEICAEVSTEGNVVVAANYNCPGQLVISGNVDAINAACEKLKAAGAKRALPLKVGGAFHSPLMQPAKDELQAAIEKTTFSAPKCPVYQNVDGKPHTDPAEIQQNLIAQLTSSTTSLLRTSLGTLFPTSSILFFISSGNRSNNSSRFTPWYLSPNVPCLPWYISP